jgi:hypothetical protein
MARKIGAPKPQAYQKAETLTGENGKKKEKKKSGVDKSRPIFF